MLDCYDVSEADEAASNKWTALENLKSQVVKGESYGVIDMYERAAWGAGATVKETEAAILEGNQTRWPSLPRRK